MVTSQQLKGYFNSIIKNKPYFLPIIETRLLADYKMITVYKEAIGLKLWQIHDLCTHLNLKLEPRGDRQLIKIFEVFLPR